MAQFTLTLAESGQSFSCRDDQSILDACLNAGVAASYNCRSGECGECLARLAEGVFHELPGADPAMFNDSNRVRNELLTCMCYPRSDLTVSISVQDQPHIPIVQTDAVITGVKRHSSNVVEVIVDTHEAVRYRSGQYFEWVLPGIDKNRSFSVANMPGDTRLLFHLRLYEGGLVSGLFETGALGLGDRIGLHGPFGTFGLSKDEHRRAIMIAGSTGLAPIRAMLEESFAHGSSRPMQLFYGTRTMGDLYDLELFEGWARRFANFAFVPVLSEEPEQSAWQGARGLVADVAASQLGDIFGAEAFLCGPPLMIDAAMAMLKRAGIERSDIHYDKFTAS